MRHVRASVFVGAVVLMLVGCGDKKKTEKKTALNKKVQSACTGDALAAGPKLPTDFPQLENVTYTQQSKLGPSEVVEGYYKGDVKAAHDDFKSSLESAKFTILFDELEAHDSEVSWKGGGRSGQVALREECGTNGKTYVHITNRSE
ncbi:MAG: hypothetical protein M3R70_02230 [Actinomycetota bacterium]|nr:hypothetical protein [Actinomycetota bacterium]